MRCSAADYQGQAAERPSARRRWIKHNLEKGNAMSSKAQMPPVPPANRSPHGPGAQSPEGDMGAQQAEATKSSRDRNLGEQGRQGDIKQNTTNQGYQQDR